MGISGSECKKCGGVMEEGFVDNRVDGENQFGIWVEGNPKNISKNKARKYRMQAYRCMSCGYTEIYSEMKP